MKNVIAIVALLGLIAWGVLHQGNQTDVSEQKNVAQSQVNNGSPIEVGLQKGQAAPDFELQTLEGKKVKLSDFRGKKVILNMWATWCPPCRAEIPDMEKFYKQNKDKGVEILGVNLTNSEKSKENIAKFIKNFGMTFPVVLDQNGSISDKYQAVAIPTSYIIDSKGIIQQKMVGAMSEETMRQLISSIE